MGRTFKHLSLTDRIIIERMLNQKYSIKKIAGVLHVHQATIYRELKRGKWIKTNSDLTEKESYSSDIAETNYRYNLTGKGKEIKLSNDHQLSHYIETMIKEYHCSPAIVISNILREKLSFSISITSRTIYNYIYKGIININKKDLPCPRKEKYQKITRNRKWSKPKQSTIENRPEDILERNEFGHWEMDSVIGLKTSKKALLVLTERKTRYERIFLVDRGSQPVVQALNKLERKLKSNFNIIFKSITVDNGTEFSDYDGMVNSVYKRKGKRLKIYYCHPYSSFERGSNENQNRYIRRWFPKGMSFDHTNEKMINKVETWMNNYPRPMFNYATPIELFHKELQAIGIKA